MLNRRVLSGILFSLKTERPWQSFERNGLTILPMFRYKSVYICGTVRYNTDSLATVEESYSFTVMLQ